jgi:replicative DNA helicase
MTGKVPPHDIQAEMSLLGAVMLNDKCWSSIADMIAPNDFYREANGTIWSAMEQIMDDVDPIDIVSLGNKLTSMGQFDQCGGFGYLMQIGDFVPTTSNVAMYARLVKEHSNRRLVIESAYKAMNNAYSFDSDAAMVMDEMVDTVGVIGSSNNNTQHVDEFIADEIEEILKRTVNDKSGIRTGFNALDDMTNGFRQGELFILGARPSMGKSALALQCALNIARNNVSVMFLSIEMSAPMVTQRLISLMTGINSKRLQNKVMDEYERRQISSARADLLSTNMFITADNRIDVHKIRAKATRLKREHNLQIIFVDYLQMIEAKGDNRTREIGVISRGLKSIAKELNVCVVALSSLSRAVEKRDDKRPVMSDLRESGDLESDADVVAFLYRPMYYADMSQRIDIDTEEAELLVTKNRNGEVGECRLQFTPAKARFDDLPTGLW